VPYLRQRAERNSSLNPIDGWSPWRFAWSLTDEPAIVVPDPRNPSHSCHVRVSESDSPESNKRLAILSLNEIWWFYIPAKQGEENVFEAGEAKYEGFWRAHPDEESKLPWPVPVDRWPARAAFLDSLSYIEAIADRIAYRGYSRCRICGCQNGYESFRWADWEWPAGLRHYVELHQVRPSAEFVTFIMHKS
jgi:hypothetical protein